MPRGTPTNLYLSPEARAIWELIPDGKRSEAVSEAIIALYSPVDRNQRIAKLRAILIAAEIDQPVEEKNTIKEINNLEESIKYRIENNFYSSEIDSKKPVNYHLLIQLDNCLTLLETIQKGESIPPNLLRNEIESTRVIIKKVSK
jgi:hypothetical protein